MRPKSLNLAIKIILFIMIDQLIKIIISNWFFESQFNIIGDFVTFSPIFNTKLSWINSWLDLGIGYIPHLIFHFLTVFLIVYIYKYAKSKFCINKTVTLSFMFFLAGALSKLIDLILWPGSLDYVQLKGLFTFDLKDVYLTVSLVFFIIFFYIPYALRNPSVLRTNARRDILIVKDFLKYVYKDIFKSKASVER